MHGGGPRCSCATSSRSSPEATARPGPRESASPRPRSVPRRSPGPGTLRCSRVSGRRSCGSLAARRGRWKRRGKRGERLKRQKGEQLWIQHVRWHSPRDGGWQVATRSVEPRGRGKDVRSGRQLVAASAPTDDHGRWIGPVGRSSASGLPQEPLWGSQEHPIRNLKEVSEHFEV